MLKIKVIWNIIDYRKIYWKRKMLIFYIFFVIWNITDDKKRIRIRIISVSWNANIYNDYDIESYVCDYYE